MEGLCFLCFPFTTFGLFSLLYEVLVFCLVESWLGYRFSPAFTKAEVGPSCELSMVAGYMGI